MMWSLATANCGDVRLWIVSLWLQKCCGLLPQRTVAAINDLVIFIFPQKWPIWQPSESIKLWNPWWGLMMNQRTAAQRPHLMARSHKLRLVWASPATAATARTYEHPSQLQQKLWRHVCDDTNILNIEESRVLCTRRLILGILGIWGSWLTPWRYVDVIPSCMIR